MTDVGKDAAARSELRDYVTAWIERDAGVNEQRLAELVTAAPAFQTLTAEEWWNVCLMLAMELKRLNEATS
jgi:hypothetical protein